MADLRTCFGCVRSFQVMFLVVSFALWNEALELDLNLTRKEIITFLGQPANLGCYATNTNSSLTYFWTKDNQTVTQSSNVRAFGNLLVVTPEEDKDFGKYECNITNGVSSTQCTILLSKGLNKTENNGGNSRSKRTTGCVNISVLMPVLAVAVMSLLLFVHLVIRGKPTPKDQMIARRMKQSEETSSRHSEASTAVIEEPIEMHVNKHTSQPTVNGNVSRSPVNARYVSRTTVDTHASRSPVNEHASRSPVNVHLPRLPVNDHGSQPPNQEAQSSNVTQF